jgi:hypothetical protein
MTADRMNIAGQNSRVTQSFSLGATTVTFSIYLYSAVSFTLRMVAVVDGSNVSRSITIPAGQWTRFAETFTSTATITGVAVRGLAGGSTGDIFLWGAQLETGSVATSYIPTVATTQTRNADVIVDTAVSGLIGQSQGTLYAEVRLTQNTVGRRIFGISNGTVSNRLAFTMGDMQIRTLKDANTSLISSSTLAAGTYKIAIAYTNAEIVFYINGSLIGTSATSGSGTYNRIDLGQTEANAAQFNDRISAAAIYTERLPNSELAQLTTL